MSSVPDQRASLDAVKKEVKQMLEFNKKKKNKFMPSSPLKDVSEDRDLIIPFKHLN